MSNKKFRRIPLSAEAEQLYRQFTDEVEEKMLHGGEYEAIRAFATKLPQQAVRLGMAIAAYQNLDLTELSGEDFYRGMQLARDYASEATRPSVSKH
jgi:hypothetical protein